MIDWQQADELDEVCNEHPLLRDLKPLRDTIITTRAHVGVEKTYGSLVLPENASRYGREYGLIVTVLKFGELSWEVGIKPGDRILVPWYAGKEIREGEETVPFWWISIGDVVATVSEE